MGWWEGELISYTPFGPAIMGWGGREGAGRWASIRAAELRSGSHGRRGSEAT